MITGAVAPAQAKEGTAAAAAVAATFDTTALKPKRLTGRYEYTHEMAAQVVELESAIRRDLADAVMAAMSQIIVNGQASTTQNPQHIEGFLTRLNGADLSTAEATAADYGKLHALAVDGVHAGRETQVMSIIGDETYQHAAGVYIAGSGKSGSQLLMERSGGCMASTYIPNAASMKQSHDPPCVRSEWRRRHARRFRGGRMADPGNRPRYLLAGKPGRHPDLGYAMGCSNGVQAGGVQAD